MSYAQSKGLLLKQRTVASLGLALLTSALVFLSVVHSRPVAGQSQASLALILLLSAEAAATLLWLLYDSLR